MTSVIGSNTQFSIDVEDIVWELDVGYIEALTVYCDRKGIEIESVATMVLADKPLMEKLKIDAESLRYLKPTGAKLEL